jgi:hypothetical protein
MVKLKLKTEWLILSFLILMIPGCYPSEDFFVEELDLVVTNYDVDEDYSRFRTFAVPDSVVRIGGDGDDDGPGPFDQLMLDLVRSNMQDLGYIEESDPENNPPDLVVLVELLVVNNVVVAPCYPGWGWWGGWPPYWGPGWCGGVPWVPVGSYTTGTIILDMIDLDQADDVEEEVPIVWAAYLNGLVTGSDASMADRIEKNIDQAFVQSSYLGTN